MEENYDEYDVEQYLGFTDFNKLNIKDDETDDYSLVCGIKIEKCYFNGIIEQLCLYDIFEGYTFDMDTTAEIKSINKDSVILIIDNTIELSKVTSQKNTEENNKIDYVISVNQLITGWSTKTMPSMVSYKIKLLYIRKKQKDHGIIK